MSDFGPAFSFMLPHEGGYVNDPDDPGGETKFGISKRTYPNLDIANLTQEDAAQIYQRDFWNSQPYQMVISQNVANKIFDLAVDMGFHRAHEITQRSCSELGHLTTADGKMGPLTVAAINACDPQQLLDAIRGNARTFYFTLATEKPTNAKFLEGWLRRANA